MKENVSYEILNPFSFLVRSEQVYSEKIAVVYEKRRYTYAEFAGRVRRLAGAISKVGVKRGDRVAFMLPNLPEMLEGHYAPLMLGAVLVPINIRLAPREIAYILNHSESKLLVFDSEFADTVKAVRDQVSSEILFVQVVDKHPQSGSINSLEYEEFLRSSMSMLEPTELDSELATIAINYTSGTTGQPKGVEYHARGAYLNALGEALQMGMTWRTVYLWTLPMFHCNGWCYTWGVTAVGGTHVCLRRADPQEIYRLVDQERVNMMCCAPTILTALYSSPQANKQSLSGLTIATGGAPPAPQVVRTIEEMGANIVHLYGLTETFGPFTISAPQLTWDELSVEEVAILKARQGVSKITATPGFRVVNEQMQDVPRDGQTIGEVVMRGNSIMSGYYGDVVATAEAFRGGWFHSGDLAVWHADGYIELKDRAKDVIISGGENISSQEVEKVIMEHPSVMEVCVVGVPDDKWGEVPKAFVTVRSGAEIDAEQVKEFCRKIMAHYKCPKYVQFGELPKTATGKVKKFVLRDLEWQSREKKIQ